MENKEIIPAKPGLVEVYRDNQNSLAALAMNLDAKLKVCDLILASGLCPPYIKSRAAVFGIVTRGAELGFSPMVSLEMFHWIQGKPTLSAQGMLAKCQSVGGVFTLVEHTETKCTIKAQRGSWCETCTFTIDDAKKQELTNKDNWKKNPKAMLHARCVSILCRHGWADVLGNLYSTEEMQDITPDKSEPVVVLEPTLDTEKIYKYSIQNLFDSDPVKYDQIMNYALEHDAALLDDGTIASKTQLKKLSNYEVRE